MFKSKKVALLGYGVDTRDVEPYLRQQGAIISILDEKKEPFGDLTRFDVLVRSPGIYRFRPDILEAEQAGVEITSKTKIFFDVCPAKIIGVTGTKGKGTTSTLIYQMLMAAGFDAYLAGNIGKGMFEYLEKLTSESWIILELSSFQLVDLHKSPHIAVAVMTTEDHLDWHKTKEAYWDAKANLTRFQNKGDWVVVNSGYEGSKWVGGLGDGKKLMVSEEDYEGEIRMKGGHQRQNVAVAARVAKIVGVSDKVISQVALSFKGLEHRLEEVASVNGVIYYDDSISTVPETAIAAIKSFTQKIVLIAGGSEKGSDYTKLGQEIGESGHVRAVILIGEMADRIEKAILDTKSKVKIVKGLKTMDEIVRESKKLTQNGDVVVLSPAAASFDMFKDYKDRGNQFKQAVRNLL